ncbi:ferric/cupric-chelate reductase [Mortierella sp. GBA43]|nr:ferric/cupric-chelate reductase [Mortierella sp. GBA43]
MWGHYYRADSIFQRSISGTSWPATLSLQERSDRRLNQVSIWERKDGWCGYTVKYWVLVFIASAVNLVWFIQPMTLIGKALEHESPLNAWAAYIGYGSGYAAIGACGMILFLVLRRSMLHALGFTYADLLPLHRGMGWAVFVWSVIHTIGYMVHFIAEGELSEEINFDGETRGPQNILGFVALVAMGILILFSLPTVRRRFYNFFLVSHRYLTIISLATTLMHYPYFITWYYVIPSMGLFLADRFIPKIVQSLAIAPDVVCAFNKDADVLTIVVTSRDRLEPLKPYYPGDYISLQHRSLSEIYHPFTIASYWPEDPYSMTLYVRTFGENKDSWTHALAELCDKNGDPTILKMNTEGVFGDRLHDYLCSDVIVIFAAGAAITTFMPLIKSVAAHIESKSKSSEPQATIKVHLICTFRYETELYCYGDFLYQITHDPRFTSWLKTDIHVSRPEKTLQLRSDAPIVIEKSSDNDEHPRVPKAKESCGDSITTASSSEPTQLQEIQRDPHVTSTSSVHDSSSHEQEHINKPLPTFLAAASGSVATIHAKRDLALTAAMLLIPYGVFIGLRYAGLEGTWDGESRWCRTTEIYDQNMTNKCMWNYTMTPGVLHIIAGSIVGYLFIWTARRLTRKVWLGLKGIEAGNAGTGPAQDENSLYLRTLLATKVMPFDGSIQFKRMRLDVEQCIQNLVSENVGVVAKEISGVQVARNSRKAKAAAKTTTVFAGGPDGFLDAVEKASRKASWSVEFHRETWSP